MKILNDDPIKVWKARQNKDYQLILEQDESCPKTKHVVVQVTADNIDSLRRDGWIVDLDD